MNVNINRAGVERVAATVLRHVRPETRAEAAYIIRVRLGCYGIDEPMVAAVIDSYFGPEGQQRSLDQVA
ncbi:MAG TPA: hypothetical protein VKA19_12795 [Alphaproteobacteria bacterium]|nr:hypothetical protein [Alphaproteobacteria bacterium]